MMGVERCADVDLKEVRPEMLGSEKGNLGSKMRNVGCSQATRDLIGRSIEKAGVEIKSHPAFGVWTTSGPFAPQYLMGD